MSRPSCLPAAAVVLSLLAGLASARIEEPRYAVTAIRLVGPASIPNGQTRPFLVLLTTERLTGDSKASAANVLALNTRLGAALHAGGARLAAGELDLERLRKAGSLELTLSCSDREVHGSEGSSGAGARARTGRMGLPWWDQPATIRARLGELESNALTVLCDG